MYMADALALHDVQNSCQLRSQARVVYVVPVASSGIIYWVAYPLLGALKILHYM